jgi:hypothetical protein
MSGFRFRAGDWEEGPQSADGAHPNMTLAAFPQRSRLAALPGSLRTYDIMIAATAIAHPTGIPIARWPHLPAVFPALALRDDKRLSRGSRPRTRLPLRAPISVDNRKFSSKLWRLLPCILPLGRVLPLVALVYSS